MPTRLNVAICEECGKEFKPPIFGSTSRLCSECRERERGSRRRILTMADVRAAGEPGFTMTSLIAGACAAVFIGMVLSGASPLDPTGTQLVQWGANATFKTLAGQPWRLVTYMFVHIGVIHLAFNMWAFWYIGQMAERLFGRIEFLFLYLLSGIGGGLASLWWHPVIVSAGASGAIFGVAGAIFASLYLKNREVPTGFLRAHLSSIGAFIFYNLIFGAAIGFVDNADHIGGLLTGAAIGALLPMSSGIVDARGIVRRVVAVVGIGAVLGVAWMTLYHGRAGAVEVGEARAAIRQKDYPAAEAHLKRAVTADPRNFIAYDELGDTYLEEQKYDLAIAVFSKAAELKPSDSYAQMELGRAYHALKKPDLAGQHFQEAVRISPNDPDARYLLGLWYVEQNAPGSAIPQLQEAARLAPDDPDAKNALAYAQNQLTQQSKAAPPHPAK